MQEADFIQGKGWPLHKAQEQKQKAVLYRGATKLPEVGAGSPESLRQEAGLQEMRDAAQSVGRAQVLHRTTLKRATALPYSIKKQFPTKLPFCEMLSRN